MTGKEFDVAEPGVRLDRFLTEKVPGFSRTYWQGLITRGGVTVSGAQRSPDYRLRAGELVRIATTRAAWPDQPFDSWILHEDKALLVLHKPSGLLMHPLGESWLKEPEAALGEPEPNLAGLLQRHRPEIRKAGTPRCGIVHRLDRQTSGALLVAKNPGSYEKLTGAFADREVQKTYRAIVLGELRSKEVEIEAPVGRQPGRRRMEVLPWGRQSLTLFKSLGARRGASLVDASPKTGRTHQIRVHLAELGHPVLGDVEWIRKPERAKMEKAGLPEPERLMLHAYRLAVAHPTTGKPLRLTAPVPKDFAAYWNRLGSSR